MTVDLSKGATVELVKTLSDDIRLGTDGTIYNSAGDAVRNSANGAYVVQSETGNPIYFDDGADSVPVKELIVNLEPKQSGTGDPSPTNVRPISGYDGVTVKRNGKNLLPPYSQSEHTINGLTLTNNNGKYVLNGTTTARASFDITVHLGVGSYNLGFNNPISNGSVSIYIILPPSTMVYNLPFTSANREVPINITESADYIFRITIASSVTLSNFELTPMIRLASVTDSTFEPYQAEQTYSITFPSSLGTVYGGSLNVTTGELVVDRAIYRTSHIAGSVESTSAIRTNITLPNYNGAPYDSTIKCNLLQTANSYTEVLSTRQNSIAANAVGLLLLNVYSEGAYVQDIATINAMLPSDGLVVAYPTTPTTVQLTPTEVTTLLGSNTIQSDGSMELDYRADISKVIEKLTNAIISLGANI